MSENRWRTAPWRPSTPTDILRSEFVTRDKCVVEVQGAGAVRMKHEVKRVTISLVMALLMTSLVFTVPAQSAVAPRLRITERLSNASPSTSTTIHATACWFNAQRGDTVELDEQSPSTLLWKTVTHATISTIKGCKVWARPSGAIGQYPYRTE